MLCVPFIVVICTLHSCYMYPSLLLYVPFIVVVIVHTEQEKPAGVLGDWYRQEEDDSGGTVQGQWPAPDTSLNLRFTHQPASHALLLILPVFVSLHLLGQISFSHVAPSEYLELTCRAFCKRCYLKKQPTNETNKQANKQTNNNNNNTNNTPTHIYTYAHKGTKFSVVLCCWYCLLLRLFRLVRLLLLLCLLRILLPCCDSVINIWCFLIITKGILMPMNIANWKLLLYFIFFFKNIFLYVC